MAGAPRTWPAARPFVKVTRDATCMPHGEGVLIGNAQSVVEQGACVMTDGPATWSSAAST